MLDPGKEIVLEPPERIAGPAAPHSLAFVARIRQGDRLAELNFRFTDAAPEASPLALEAMLPLALVPAMKLGSPIRIEGEIDRRMLDGADQFQEIFSAWYPEYQRIPITATAVDRQAAGGDQRGVGLFFSGGVDSTYSMLKHRDEITHAVFVHGCDIPLADESYRKRTSERLRKAAESFGVALVEVETDLLDFSDQYSHWGYHYHGCGLAGIAMLLAGSLRKVFIASSDPYVELVPWGSSYVTDPLWSSAGLEVVHDGAECDRLGKTRLLAQDAAALKHLRVCFQTPPDGYNCGRCEKCYRTMVLLRLCGGLEHCPAFDEPLDLERMVASEEVQKAVPEIRAWQVAREEAERQGTDPELIAALADLMQRSSYIQFAREFARQKNDITAAPAWREALPKFRTRLWESLLENDPQWFTEKVLKWLPKTREEAFDRLWRHDRRWFKRRYLTARLARLLDRLRGKS